MELESCYEVSRIISFICSHNFTRVALQFPDELLKDSTKIVRVLRQELNALCMNSVKLCVMADATYGSCCVDEVGAAHVNADCVIHFGHTCLSPTSTLPALFIFGKASISASNCVENLLNFGLKNGKPVLVLFGLEYAHSIPQIKELFAAYKSCSSESTSCFEPLFAEVRCSATSPSDSSRIENQLGLFNDQADTECNSKETSLSYSIGGLSWRLPELQKMENYLIFWIGLENSAFTNVLLTFSICEIVRYAANKECLVTDLSQQKKILKRRYYLIEKAKDASMIGILVGTLGAAGYLHMIHQMKDLITKAGKKAYTFVMGRPNPSKLANFPECDVFIHVSCPQTALLDSKEFLAPVITPFEAMLALDGSNHWTGSYVMDFRDLISSTSLKVRDKSEEARYSFLLGGYVEDLGLQDNNEVDKDETLALVNVTEKALKMCNEDSSLVRNGVAKSGAEYFARRSYHGLDINNSSLPDKILMGRSGKASGYKDEKAFS